MTTLENEKNMKKSKTARDPEQKRINVQTWSDRERYDATINGYVGQRRKKWYQIQRHSHQSGRVLEFLRPYHILSHYAHVVHRSLHQLSGRHGIKRDGRRKSFGTSVLGCFASEGPDLRFELVECTLNVDIIAIYYKSVMGKMAIE